MEEPDDEYTTLRMEAAAEWKVHGSRFIALAIPATTIEEVERHLARVRREYFDATHHCYAYRLGVAERAFRAYDDGEPAGSAGKPILSAIDKANVTDVLVIVTRYFGGTKLGVGGLVRAYGTAAGLALERSAKVVRHAYGFMEITFPHERVGGVMHVIGKAGARIIDTYYDEEVHLQLAIRRSRIADLRTELINGTSGNISITIRPGHGS